MLMRPLTCLLLMMLALLPATGTRAQGGLDDSLLFMGTTADAGAETFAWLIWQPADPLFISSKTVALYRKMGPPASPANYQRVSVVQPVVDTRLISSLLPVAEKMGQNLAELDQLLSEMYQEAFPGGDITTADKIAAILTGAHGNADNMQRLVLLGRQHPAMALCGGFAAADLISATGVRTYELREFDNATGEDIGVLGRVTIDPAAVLTLPAPGPPVEVPDTSPKGHLNVSMRWATPNGLRDLSPLQYGYDAYRLPADIAVSEGWDTMPPPSLQAVLNLGGEKVNRLAILPPVLLTEAQAADANNPTVYLTDDKKDNPFAFGFVDNTEWAFFAVARDLLARGGLPSRGTVMKVYDRMPPNPPQKVDVVNDVRYDGTSRDQRLLVTWQPPEIGFSEGISSYLVYRWRTPHHIAKFGRDLDPVTALPERNLIAILPGHQTSFRDDGSTASPAWAVVDDPPPDAASASKTYYYTVRAMDNSKAGNLSGHSAPAWGVIRDYKGPNGVTGSLRMYSRYPNVEFEDFTQVPYDNLSDDQGHLLFLCTGTDPGLDYAEFSMETTGNVIVKVGRAYFREVNGVQTAALRLTLPSSVGDRSLYCVVATKDGVRSDSEPSPNAPGTIADRYVRAHWTATVGNFPSFGNDADWRHDAVDLATGETNDIEGRFTPGADAREYRVYRRVDNSAQTLVASGNLPGNGAQVTWTDPSPPATGSVVCYFLQLFDEHGNGGELVQQGECIESGSSSRMPTPMLEPLTGTTPLNPRMNVRWFCSTAGVERFEVWVARSSGNAPGNNGSGLSGDVAGVHPNELPLQPEAEGLDFYVFETGLARHLSDGGEPHFNVTLPVTNSDTYTVMIRAVGKGKFGERLVSKFSNSEKFEFSLRTLGLGLPVPWPDRPLPPKADFHPGILAVAINQAVMAPWIGTAVRIGEFQADPPGTQISSPDQNNPGIIKIFHVPTHRDIEDYLYTNDLVAQKERLETRPGLILPVVLYRVQVPNERFPQVPGDVVQVSPMIHQIAQIEDGPPGPSTVVTDPFIAILPRTETGLSGTISVANHDVFLLDRQPVIAHARYKYFLVRFSPTKEIERVIVTNEVTASLPPPTP